jgi:CelD/BcsL family acetyltransferase involved in cellulose biosynthesis
MTIAFSVEAVPDAAALAADWRALQAEAPHNFFQGWAWTGCQFENRFTDPVLLRAQAAGRTVALALFNRRRGALGASTLHLGESGNAQLDAPYIEHNAPLLASTTPATTLADMLRAARIAPLAARRPARPRALVLSGVTDAMHGAAAGIGGRIAITRTHQAPWLDLAHVRESGMAHLSANTRQQLRRSLRRYEATGPLGITRAADTAQAHEFLDAMAVLHQRTWTRRGQPGAFANPFFARFHHELIDRAPDDVDLLRIVAGNQTIGYLHNFNYRGRACAYQSGFDYDTADSHQKPGLTCHWLAIALYAAAGNAIYDFLAGADRYKRSLATGTTTLSWLTVSSTLGELLRRA